MIKVTLFTETSKFTIPVKPWLELVSSCKVHGNSSFSVCAKDVYKAILSHSMCALPGPVLLQHADPTAGNNLHLVKDDCMFPCALTTSGSRKAMWAVLRLTRRLPVVVFDMIESYICSTFMDVSIGDFASFIQVRHIFASPQFTIGVNGKTRKTRKPQSHWKKLNSILWTFRKK